jgi:hypothetical protein
MMSQFFRFHSLARVSIVAVLTLALLGWALHKSGGHNLATVQAHSTTEVETIVLIRHGELAEGGLGQLDCQGLNRAIALPRVFAARFAAPAAIFAPDPADTVTEDGGTYSYVRPLATIEPTAISRRLPVNTQFGYSDIAGLQSAVTAAEYANSTVFIAWEHYQAYLFARNLLSTYGDNPAVVPAWPSGDFDRMYIFHITRGSGIRSTLTFQVQFEDLTSSLKTTCPTS